MGTFCSIINERPFSLIASLPANDPELARAAWDNGADAVKVHINLSHRAGGVQFGSFEEERPRLENILADAGGPLGIVLGADPESAGRDLDRVIRAGFDFISIYAHHAPASLLGAGIGKMFAADHSYSPEEIKSLAAMADIFEASIVNPASYGEALTVRDLAAYGALCAALPIPVVVPTQKKIVPREVPRLLAAGVSALMIGVISAGRTAREYGAKTAEFKQAVERAVHGAEQ